jgi:hypothetical protein
VPPGRSLWLHAAGRPTRIDAAPVADRDLEVRNSGADEMTNSVMIPVVPSSPAETAVSVTYAVAGGTATPGTDFTVAATCRFCR